jgi:hypothetical protein
MTSGPTLSRSTELTDRSVPTCSLNVPVPWPVDQRLTQLVRLVTAEKLGPTAKHELVAALIQTADASGLQLLDKVLTYRRATVGQAVFWLPADQDPVTFEERKLGRPPKSASG